MVFKRWSCNGIIQQPTATFTFGTSSYFFTWWYTHETYLSYASMSSTFKDRMSFAASSFLCPNSQCMILSSSIALQSVSDARRVSCHAATCCPLHPELFKSKLWGNCELTQRQRLHTRLGPNFSPKFHVDTALLPQLSIFNLHSICIQFTSVNSGWEQACSLFLWQRSSAYRCISSPAEQALVREQSAWVERD